MSSDTFSSAIPQLSAHTEVSIPQLYTHLCTLLTRYTSGLSLPIALDTLPSNLTHPTYHQFTLIETRSNPLVHLLKPTNSSLKQTSYHAFFPLSTLPSLPHATILRLPLAPVSSDALTLAKKLFPHTEITQAHLPTLSVIIQLPFPSSLPLPLPHPHRTYTLQNIWNLRDLTPPAVYATLHQISSNPSTLTLKDNPTSPPVYLKLLPQRISILSSLKLPCNLLVTSPLVTPTETTFILQDTPTSTFFFQSFPSNKKRVRQHTPTLHTPQSLNKRETREIGHPITVHARVTSINECEVGQSIVINIGHVDVVIPHGRVDIGDEVLLTRVQFRKRWVAETMHNISTMLGLLYCPFITKFITIEQATSLCAGSPTFRTAFVKVCVKSVDTADMVRLAVKDCGEHVEKRIPNNAVRKATCGVVCLKHRGFQHIFGRSRNSFLQLEREQVCEAVQHIRDDVWLMIVCCGVARHPVLTACLRAS